MPPDFARFPRAPADGNARLRMYRNACATYNFWVEQRSLPTPYMTMQHPLLTCRPAVPDAASCHILLVATLRIRRRVFVSGVSYVNRKSTS